MTDTPAAPAAPAPTLASDLRAHLVAQRIERVRDLIARRNAGGALLDARRDFAWLTVGGQNHILFTTEAGVAPVLVTADDAAVLAPVNEFDRIADEEIAGLPLRMERVAWIPGAAHARATDIASQGRLLTSSDLAEELVAQRSLLSPHEHARMEWLAGVIGEVVQDAMDEVTPGSSEDDVVGHVSDAFSKRAVRLPVVLIAADDRIARYRHPLSASREIRHRVMLVVVVERWGLHVAHTQFRELEPIAKELEARVQALTQVLAQMRSATVPGNALRDVLTAARDAYDAAGLADEWTLHHQGGTIGYQARERIATPDDATVIEPGMAFAWNPSALGCKLEETLYLDSDGRQRVIATTTPSAEGFARP